MLRKLAVVMALSPVLWLPSVQAFGLGEIDVKSHLTQPLSAVIPVADIGGEDAESLVIRVAGTEEFARAGLERSGYLSTLKFEFRNDAGHPRIVVSSNKAARHTIAARTKRRIAVSSHSRS